MKTTNIKTTMLIVALLIINYANAQLKIKDGGRVGIGTNDVSWYKTNINAPYGIMALNLRNATPDWGYISRAEVTSRFTKSWVVSWNAADRFCVLGEGSYFYKNGWMWSDASLKQNIEQISNPMDKIINLHGVYFKYKPETIADSAIGGTTLVNDDKRYMGLIAQEVETVVPEVVTENNKGLKAVSYQNLVALLIEGMKSQQLKIDAQAVQIQQLTQEITDIKGKTVYTDVDKTKLYQNDPNPFIGSTTITYFIDENVTIASAAIEIRNLMGILQTTIPLGDRSGLGKVIFDGSSLSNGYYVYSLKLNGSLKDSKMLLIGE